MGKVIAVANQKGGVGKTTTTINLSAALAMNGANVLVVDCDPQGNATSGLDVKSKVRAEENYTSYDLMTSDVPVKDCLQTIKLTNEVTIGIIPSDVNLSAAESDLNNVDGRNFILRDKLQGIKNDYDFIIIDCPPSLTVLTINALAAADSVIIPIQCEFYAMEGLSQLMQTINLARLRLNSGLKIEGILFTMYDTRTNLSQEVVNNVKEVIKERIFNSVIPRNVKLAEAPSFGLPICIYDPRSSGALAYNSLAMEILRSEKTIVPKKTAPKRKRNTGKTGEKTSTKTSTKKKEQPGKE